MKLTTSRFPNWSVWQQIIALPSVILMMIYGQTRIFFVMARDGLLPEKLADIHPTWKTPWLMTIVTGIFVAIAAAFFPVGQLADISNSGTLFAFFMVSIAVLVLRKTDPNRHRPFKTPMVWVVAPIAAAGFVLVLQLANRCSIGLANLGQYRFGDLLFVQPQKFPMLEKHCAQANNDGCAREFSSTKKTTYC